MARLLLLIALAGCGLPRAEKGATCRAVEAGRPVPQPPYSTLPISRRAIRFSQPVERELYVTTRNVPFVRNLLDSFVLRTRAKQGRPIMCLRCRPAARSARTAPASLPDGRTTRPIRRRLSTW